ncbi:hypothetical protein [Pontivivens ytuae]|uniref:Uncharacterized protein n=1 Tax=Pontivivens ytuae TaxID=2789856 RepID=A0A7S9LV33_9RHOB|nr:hypothetical protein [Pontivivens ytuae]QPH55721.1 hypothetical protein I0K15_08340 [Pontivivens ytuae]
MPDGQLSTAADSLLTLGNSVTLHPAGEPGVALQADVPSGIHQGYGPGYGSIPVTAAGTAFTMSYVFDPAGGYAMFGLPSNTGQFFIRMTEAKPGQDGVANFQYYASGTRPDRSLWESFKVHSLDGPTYALESIVFPNTFLQVSGTSVSSIYVEGTDIPASCHFVLS